MANLLYLYKALKQQQSGLKYQCVEYHQTICVTLQRLADSRKSMQMLTGKIWCPEKLACPILLLMKFQCGSCMPHQVLSLEREKGSPVTLSLWRCTLVMNWESSLYINHTSTDTGSVWGPDKVMVHKIGLGRVTIQFFR